MQQLVDWMTVKPASLFGLSAGTMMVGDKADLAIFDLESAYNVDPKQFLSKGVNTPFGGWTLYGDTSYTFVNGKTVWQKGGQ